MSWRAELKIPNQYSISILWLNLNTQVEHLNLTWILKSRILTWIKSWRVENSTRPQWLDSTRLVYWSFSLFNILMILFNWSRAHWRSCFLILMFHEIATFWDSAEASKERRKIHLFAMLLSRWIIQDSTDLKSCIMMKDWR